mgnify:CR=1 FL=1|tara:strand:+ start:427 stop:720 length:294 start_codon:yes stop_codon:yes gene_type:complete
MTQLIIKKSNKPDKKLQAIFIKPNGRSKTTHFGASGMDDYTLTKDKDQRKRYRDRHRKDLATNDPKRAGYLSMYILWGDSTSRQQNIKNYKKRFNFT